ncbi:type I phosphodiesterase / nucleotide pyrophosphatase [Sulfuricaulis limicola]|uniref:Type I phosphodiesterase / nucleotide pyrophosphatase n=1 Tax=Sulfuricaulis limicola TaxID=1620215 RepID=A0A1B4XD07_9GAMM|nr:alkaline phosphatase family protein [Sulfuricaulis limicola]BAV32670.1 type I phosphodiesterase / nucleotide pyrophosphatase [Sulfuricaulis limicola]
MAKSTFGILLLGLLFAAPGFARDIETVLIVSIDALHPDALSKKTSPTLHALMRPGRYTLEGKSVDPPKTLIAHTAMLTGLTPEENGKTDNNWKPGMPTVAKPTLFDDAKRRGFRTAFYYAKPKLGYLVSKAVDKHALARDDGVDQTLAFFAKDGRRFVFLHVSGLENAGTDYGWLSPEYLDELSYIDMALAPLFEAVSKRGAHLIVVTSDHAGHGRLHGTRDPEDYKLPLILAGGQEFTPLPPGTYLITGLRSTVQQILAADEAPAVAAKMRHGVLVR